MVGGRAEVNKPEPGDGAGSRPGRLPRETRVLTALLLVIGWSMVRLCRGPADTLAWLAGYGLQWIVVVVLLARAPRERAPYPAALLVGIGLAARLMLVGSAPWLSDDLYRYLLDGRVLLHGINPFRFPPADPRIVAVAPELAARVNHPDVPTIYPPLAQGLFLLAAALRLDVTGWRVLTSVADVAAAVAIARLFGGGARGGRAAAVYALCPLAIWEAGANGHLEAWAALAVAAAALAWQRDRPAWGGALLGAAGLVKLYPALLVPLYLRRPGFVRGAAACALILAAGFAPFAVHGVDVFAGLRTYLARWRFNSPLHTLLLAAIRGDAAVRGLPFALAAAACLWCGFRRYEPRRGALVVLLTLLLSGPTLHPWYALWLLPWLGPCPAAFPWAFVAAMGGAYAVWWSVAAGHGWRLPSGAAELIWGIVGAAAVLPWALAHPRRSRRSVQRTPAQ